MKERPILFSAPMVRAILEGRKTQTRRVVALAEFDTSTTPGYDFHFRGTRRGGKGHLWQDLRRDALMKLCPYGVPGDRLIVKEATWQWCRKVKSGLTKTGRQKYSYRLHGGLDTGSVVYCADHPQRPDAPSYAEPDMMWRYKPARFMQKHLSRITLEIAGVRVQRVQEIS
jgi:hypothetical protein